MKVSEEEAIALLEGLVRIPSPSGHEREASEFLVSWMQRHVFEAKVDEVGNAVGSKGTGEREILLLGHIDTFPGNPPVRQEGDLLYGRGSVDAKGPLCTFAVAAAQVEPPEGWKITVVGAVEEESATSKGARHVLTSRPEGPAACVIGEPSRWDRVTLGYKGRLLLDVRMKAPYSHSAGTGELPAEKAVSIWLDVLKFAEDFNRGRAKAFDRLIPSLRRIATRDEGAYGEAKLTMGFRLPPDLGPDELESRLREVLRSDESTELALAFRGHEQAYRAPKNTRLVRAFLNSIRSAGGRPKFVVKTGTSDMNVVGPHWPTTEMVAYGPGDSSLDHTPNEHTDLREYLTAIEVLKGVLQEMVSG